MRKLHVGRAAVGFMAALCLVFVGTTIWATDGAKDIRVMYRNIGIVVNGAEVKTSQEPFIYEGRTYIPLRAVAEAMGADVKWDGEKWQALINSNENSVALSDLTILASKATGDSWRREQGVADKAMGTVTYPRALWMGAGCYEKAPCFYELALNGEFTKLDALVGLPDGERYGTNVVVSVDDREIMRFDLVPGGKPVPVKADIKGGLRLKITAVTGSSTWYPTVAITGSVAK